MRINHKSGVLYDLINYNVTFFNRERLHAQLKIYAEKEEEIFVFYDEMRNESECLDPPESLYPFFYYEAKMPCVMSEYFYENFDFLIDDDAKFFYLLKDIDNFKEFVFRFYLEQHNEINIEAVIEGDTTEIDKALAKMHHHGERAEIFADLFRNFDQLADKLYKYLDKLSYIIELFHKGKKELYQKSIDKFRNSDCISIFKKTYDINENIDLTNQIYSVCFMNQYVILYQQNRGYTQYDYGFILGIESFLTMPKILNYNHITYTTVAKIFANKIIDSIIKELKKEEATVAQLSAKLNISQVTLYKFIRILFDDAVIKIARTNWKERYYKLNPEYFLVAKTIFSQNIDNLLNGLL